MAKQICYRKECTRIRSELSIFLNRRRPPQFEGHTFCSDSCLLAYFENELNDRWRHLQLEKGRRIPRPKIGTILMQTTYLTREQLDEAIRLQKQAQVGRLGEWLLRLGFVEEHQITAALARQFGLPLINLRNSSANAEAVRMIPGKVAKCSGLLPVGFDDDEDSIRVAVCAPVDFLSQQAIQRMVQKGIRVYIGDQSKIQQLIEEWYGPEDLDLSTVPTFSSMDELVEVGSEIVATAIENRAEDIRAELLQDFFWVRLDYAAESHHYFFRYISAPVEDLAPAHGNEFVYNYAAGR
jgi:hypothetical protein